MAQFFSDCVIHTHVFLLLNHLALFHVHLTIIPRARMDYESIAREAEGQMDY